MRIPSPAQKKSLESRSRAYHEQLLSPEGYDLYAWLTEERGLSPEALDHFRLGAVLDPDQVSEAPQLAREVKDALESGQIGLHADDLEQFADRLR